VADAKWVSSKIRFFEGRNPQRLNKADHSRTTRCRNEFCAVDLIEIYAAFEIRLLNQTACPQNRARGSSWVLITSVRLQLQQFDYFVAQLLNFVVVGSELYGTAC
jgi:hypothetical protein